MEMKMVWPPLSHAYAASTLRRTARTCTLRLCRSTTQHMTCTVDKTLSTLGPTQTLCYLHTKTIMRRVSTHSGMLEFCLSSMSTFASPPPSCSYPTGLRNLTFSGCAGIGGMQLPLAALRLVGSTVLALCLMRTHMLSGSFHRAHIPYYPCICTRPICCRHWCACSGETRRHGLCVLLHWHASSLHDTSCCVHLMPCFPSQVRRL